VVSCESQRRAWFMSIELKATPTHAIRMLRCVLITTAMHTTHATASSGPVLAPRTATGYHLALLNLGVCLRQSRKCSASTMVEQRKEELRNSAAM
jgi:hypothetical protein